MKKLLKLALASVLAISMLTGCSNKGESSKNSSDAKSAIPLESLVVTYVTSPLNVPTIIEKSQEVLRNAFENEGTTIEYAEITSGADQTQALASGDVHILNAVGATSVILSVSQQADIKILSMYSRSPKAFAMYSKDDTIKTPEDLKGKIIAGPAGTNLHQLLIAYLATANLTLDDVQYVSMGIPESKAGLDGGSVDVALLAGPTGYNAGKQGYNMVTNGEGLIDAIIAVAVTQDFYDRNPEVIEKFIASQQEIVSFMNENTEEAIEIVADALDLEIDAVKEMYPQYNFSTEISKEDIEGFQRTADFMLEAEMIESAVDVTTLFINQ